MIERRVRYKQGSDKLDKPRPKPTYINGNVIDLHPYLTDEYWKIKTETDDDDTSKKGIQKIKEYAGRSVPPRPYGTETFGWPEYEDYLEKIKPGAIPLSFPKFMDQLDMRPEDYWGRIPRRKEQEGVMKVVAEPMAWQKKYLLNFYPKEYLDSLNRDGLEKLFDEFLLQRATKGRA